MAIATGRRPNRSASSRETTSGAHAGGRWPRWGKKLILVGFLALLEPGSLNQLYVAVAAALVACSLQLHISPYRRADDNLLATMSSVALTFVLLGTLSLKTVALEPTGSPEVTTGVLLIAAVVIVVVAFAMVLQEARTAHAMPVARWASDGTPIEPPLALGTGSFHAFVSHQWSSGQDQARTIKAQLIALVPGLRVFLDVDDLSDIGALEPLIDATDVVLVFLAGSQTSDGARSDYMRSANCLRELRRAVAQKKRIVFVRETDPQHGAVDMDVHRRDCPDQELRDALDAHPIVPWHRTQPFHLVTLRLIAQSIVGSWRPDDSIRVLGESPSCPTPRPPLPPAHFHLYASPSNPGAAEVADLLAKEAGHAFTLTTTDRQLAACMLVYLSDALAMAPPDLVAGGGATAAQRLHSELAAALDEGMAVVLVHEQREGRGAVPFDKIIMRTPTALREAGLYTSSLATPLLDGEAHLRASVRVLLARVLAVQVAGASQPRAHRAQWCQRLPLTRRLRRLVRVARIGDVDSRPSRLLEMAPT